jgi:hypothetical protein
MDERFSHLGPTSDVDAEGLASLNINSPVNATYMTEGVYLTRYFEYFVDKGGGLSLLWRLDPVKYEPNTRY